MLLMHSQEQRRFMEVQGLNHPFLLDAAFQLLLFNFFPVEHSTGYRNVTVSFAQMATLP